MFSGIVAAIGRITHIAPLEQGVRLTVDGEALLPHARQLLSLERQTASLFEAAQPRGRLRLGRLRWEEYALRSRHPDSRTAPVINETGRL